MKNKGVEVPLEHSTEVKDLGVWTDDKLKFARHVGQVAAKGSQLLGLIKRSFVHRNSDVIKKTVYGTCATTPEVRQCSVASEIQEGDRTTRKGSEAGYKVSVQLAKSSI